jgi:thiol-disulfide isomerase/thioredoxin
MTKVRSLKVLLQILFSVATLPSVFSGCSPVSPAAKSLVGNPAPNVRFTLLDGTPVPLDIAAGKTAAILFWTTWCGHSRGTIEDLEKLAKRYLGRKDIVFFAVSLDKFEDIEAVKARIQSQGLSDVTHAFSGNDIQDEAFLGFKGDSVPYVAVLDARGIVRSVGNSTSDLESYLESKFGPR